MGKDNQGVDERHRVSGGTEEVGKHTGATQIPLWENMVARSATAPPRVLTGNLFQPIPTSWAEERGGGGADPVAAVPPRRSRSRSVSQHHRLPPPSATALPPPVQPTRFYGAAADNSARVPRSNHSSAAPSREQSIGAAVGFLLQRARDQHRQRQHRASSSKRSRSASMSSVASAVYKTRAPQPAPQPETGYPFAPSAQAAQRRHVDSATTASSMQPQRKVARTEGASLTRANLPTRKEQRTFRSGLASIPFPSRLHDSAAATTTAHTEGQVSAAAAGTSSATTIRVQPLWSLVGTFKTGMDNVVQLGRGSLHWHQRNPHGGFQAFQMPLSLIVDVTCAKVVSSPTESATSVVIRSAGKPSQVTFGFVRSADALAFKAKLTAAIASLKL